MFEELLAAGVKEAEYDAYLIKIGDGDQFGSGFVAVNPNSKIPALVDRSGSEPVNAQQDCSILADWTNGIVVLLQIPSMTSERRN